MNQWLKHCRGGDVMKFLDLFAGAGGLSEGFVMAGFSPAAHIEMDKAACYTLKTRAAYHWLKEQGRLDIYHDYLHGRIDRNSFYAKIPQDVLESVMNYQMSKDNLEEIFDKIDGRLGDNRINLIIGGPPCQAYSLAGRSRDANNMIGDERNYLYKIYAEFLRRYKPKYFLFENVLGLLSAKEPDGTRHFDAMCRTFKECGYSVETKIFLASDYGVLQSRRRLILIGKLGDDHGFYPLVQRHPTEQDGICVSEIFNDLPPLHAKEGTPLPTKTRHYEGKYLYDAGIKEKDEEEVTLHYARYVNDHDKDIYRRVVEAWNRNQTRLKYTDLPKEMLTHKNTTSFLDRFNVVADNLSYAQTVVAHLSKDGHFFIHPDIKQNRSITPREAARLQTFPDNFHFETSTGKPAFGPIFRQIGNAVPVRLAYSLAKAINECFVHPDSYQRDFDIYHEKKVKGNKEEAQTELHF